MTFAVTAYPYHFDYLGVVSRYTAYKKWNSTLTSNYFLTDISLQNAEKERYKDMTNKSF